MRTTGSWQAADSSQGYPGGTGQFGYYDPRSTGSWQTADPEHGYGWAAGHAQYGQQAPGPGQPPGPWQQAGAGQYAQGVRNPGTWQQAPGPDPAQGWARPGQPQHQAPPHQAPPHQAPPHQAPPHQAPPHQAPYEEAGQPGQPQHGQPYPGADVRNTGSFGRVGSPVIRQRDSALPDPPPGGKGPVAAIENDNITAFARDLRALRSKSGLDYPDMAEKSHYTMRTLASAAGGLRLPALPVLIAYVNACGGDVAEWEDRWSRLTKSGQKGNAELPSAQPGEDSGQPGAGSIPPGARQTGEIYVITSARSRDGQW